MKYTTPWSMHMALIIQFLLASMLVLPGAESSEYDRRLELIHVDANGGFTRGELVNPACERAHLRAAMLSPADTQDKDFMVMVELTTHKSREGHFAYLMHLEVYDMGENPHSIRAVADTGSEMVWMKKVISNKQLEELPCSCTSEGEMLYAFIKTYGMDGTKAVKGFIWTDQKLSLILSPSSKTKSEIKKIRSGFAIHVHDSLLPSSADGIVGLGRNEHFSLVNQLRVTKFSYCLSNSTDKNSPFWFGDVSVPDLESLKSTPLFKVPPHTARYYVELLGISIGDGNMKELPMRYFKHKGQDGNRVMFIDSGSSRTILEPCVFEELEKQLDQHRKKLRKSDEPITDDEVHTCFPHYTADHEKVDLVLHFNGAQMSIPWDKYMRQGESSDFCLAVIKGTAAHGLESILGNNLQHNIYMRYDIDPAGEKLSFKKADCSKSISKRVPILLP